MKGLPLPGLDQESSNRLRNEIVSVARAVALDELGVLEGCRRLVLLSATLPDTDDEPWLTIRAVESELEGVPLGDYSDSWAQEPLQRIDRRAAEYLAKVTDLVREACLVLVDKYGGAAGPPES